MTLRNEGNTALTEYRSYLATVQERCWRCGRFLPNNGLTALPGPCDNPRCEHDGGLLDPKYGGPMV